MVIRFLATTIIVICLLSLTGCRVDSGGSGSGVVSSAGPCEKADNLNWISGKNLCFAIKTFMSDGKVARPVLRVFLHGDNSKGGPSDYMYRYALFYAPGVVSVAMLRPDHYDREGRRSSPKTYGRRNWETEESIDAVAAAVRKLKSHHKATRVVMIGHSGGANLSAVMLGRHPGVADAALLAGCACDKEAKRMMQGRTYRAEDINPIDYVDYIPLTTKVIAITGSLDTTNPADLCRPYIAHLKARGVSARLDIVEGARHGFSRLGGSIAYQVGLSELSKQ
ncbi:MAG: prolyl oligopeptidase family serine peptidase [Caldilineaceae bacterium]|nr:prolyl oligopeptidase family serine peptidase [Caldilineaceae bacterium]